jgi:hypothetical protein
VIFLDTRFNQIQIGFKSMPKHLPCRAARRLRHV